MAISAIIVSTATNPPAAKAIAPQATPALPLRKVHALTMPEPWPVCAGAEPVRRVAAWHNACRRDDQIGVDGPLQARAAEQKLGPHRWQRRHDGGAVDADRQHRKAGRPQQRGSAHPFHVDTLLGATLTGFRSHAGSRSLRQSTTDSSTRESLRCSRTRNPGVIGPWRKNQFKLGRFIGDRAQSTLPFD